MRRIRVIPVLLIQNGGLVKTVKFKDPVYVGDPINAVKIFNEKEVDEIVVLDISASINEKSPNLQQIKEIASEAFMPFAYGGGIRNIGQVSSILNIGVEKVVINTSAIADLTFVSEIARRFGSQSLIISIDVKKNFFGKYVLQSGDKKIISSTSPLTFAKQVEDAGAGEIMLQVVERDGMLGGYDTELIRKFSDTVSIPVIACSGARNVSDFASAVVEGASAVAAGSMFVFHGKHKAVLINFPSQEILTRELYEKMS